MYKRKYLSYIWEIQKLSHIQQFDVNLYNSA